MIRVEPGKTLHPLAGASSSPEAGDLDRLTHWTVTGDDLERDVA